MFGPVRSADSRPCYRVNYEYERPYEHDAADDDHAQLGWRQVP